MTTEAKKGPMLEEIDLGAVFTILWNRRRMIVLGTLALTILAAGFSFLIPIKYHSKGLYKLGVAGVSIQLYRRSSLNFANPDDFLKYAYSNLIFSKEERLQISRAFKDRANAKNWIVPFYTFSKEDTRNLPLLAKEQSNPIIGLNLTFITGSPELTTKMVSMSGRYIRDCLMYITLFEYISSNAIASRTDLQKNDNDLIESRFGLEQQEQKLAEMRAIMRRYPDAGRNDNWQLMTTAAGGERFLSPVTQLIGIETTMIDLRREVVRLERNRQKLLLRIQFFDQCKTALDKPIEYGEPLFQFLKTTLAESFDRETWAVIPCVRYTMN